MNTNSLALSTLQWIAAAVLAWAGVTKFLGTAGNVYIFTLLEMEPFGRWLIGVIEVGAALMLAGNRFAALGALFGFGTMCGAVIAHVSFLGVSVHGDGGMHIALLTLVIAATSYIVVARRSSLPLIGDTL